MMRGINGPLAVLLTAGAWTECAPDRRAQTDSPARNDAAAERARLERSCEAEEKAEACVSLAQIVWDQGGSDGGREARGGALLSRATELYGARCDRGDRDGCAFVARVANKKLLSIPRGDPKGDGVAKTLFDALEKGCLAGDGASCRDAARAYVRGEWLSRDLSRARSLAERGCTGALTEACTELGFLYADGMGVAPDLSRAQKLFERGCAGGDGGGCLGIGGLIAERGDSKPDMARVTSLFEKGCRLKYGPACSALGRLFLLGRDVPRDEAQGMRWMAEGCELGDRSACNEARIQAPSKPPLEPAPSPLF